MSWEFLVVIVAIVAVPGADFIVILRNTVTGGRAAGTATAVGVGLASLIQGTLASVGLGTLIVKSQVAFTILKWLGICYLALLAAQALRSAWLGRYPAPSGTDEPGQRMKALRQGFLCNITNPKMFVFYLSLLPQFVGASASVWAWLSHAWVLPLIGTGWLLLIVLIAGVVRDKLLRPLTRRIIDTVSGFALLGFSTRLALTAD